MAWNNELIQLKKVIEKVQAKMKESDKKVESRVVTFQNLNNETWMENNEQTLSP